MHVRAHRLLAVSALAALALSACSSGDGATDDAPSQPAASAPEGAADGSTLALTGTSALKWDPTEMTAVAGEVTFTLTAEGAIHNVVLEQLSDQVIVEAGVGETASATVTLAPGTYTYYCSITGHRAAGMEGVLTVS